MKWGSIKILLLLFAVSYLLFAGTPAAEAVGPCPPVTCPAIQKKSAFLPDCTYYEGNRATIGRDTGGNDLTVEQCCGCRNVNVFVQLLVKTANWVFGLVGAAALVMFIYGGFKMLTAGGVAENVEAGKNALVAAVIGLAIIFSAQLLMRFVLEQVVPAEKLSGKPGEELQVKTSTPVQQEAPPQQP